MVNYTLFTIYIELYSNYIRLLRGFHRAVLQVHCCLLDHIEKPTLTSRICVFLLFDYFCKNVHEDEKVIKSYFMTKTAEVEQVGVAGQFCDIELDM